MWRAIAHDDFAPQHPQPDSASARTSMPGTEAMFRMQTLILDGEVSLWIDQGEIGVGSRKDGSLLWVYPIESGRTFRQNPSETFSLDATDRHLIQHYWDQCFNPDGARGLNSEALVLFIGGVRCMIGPD